MKTIAAIADSIENSAFDPSRCVATIQELKCDPLVMVSSSYSADGTCEKLDVTELIDSIFAECDPAVFSVGYLTDAHVISYLADKLASYKKLPVISRPCLISDNGDILVEESVYHAFTEQFIQHVKILIINNFEAELLSGIECLMEQDYMRAAKKVHNLYGCHVVLTAEALNNKAVICIGERSMWKDLEPAPKDFDKNRYELASAISCALTYGISSLESIEYGIGFCDGLRKASELTGEEEAQEDPEPEPAQEEAVSEAEPQVEAAPEAETEVTVEAEPQTQAEVEKPAQSISFVSPGKALRDIARNLDAEFAPQENRQAAPVAVTSVIDENLGRPKGEVSDLKERKPHSDSVTELQELKERLEKLRGTAGNMSS